MKNISTVFGLALGLAGVLVSPVADAAAGDWSSYRKITAIRLFNGDGAATVTLDGTIPTTCGSAANDDRKSFRVTNETVVRGLEAVYFAGKSVKVRVSGVCSNTFDNPTEFMF